MNFGHTIFLTVRKKRWVTKAPIQEGSIIDGKLAAIMRDGFQSTYFQFDGHVVNDISSFIFKNEHQYFVQQDTLPQKEHTATLIKDGVGIFTYKTTFPGTIIATYPNCYNFGVCLYDNDNYSVPVTKDGERSYLYVNGKPLSNIKEDPLSYNMYYVFTYMGNTYVIYPEETTSDSKKYSEIIGMNIANGSKTTLFRTDGNITKLFVNKK